MGRVKITFADLIDLPGGPLSFAGAPEMPGMAELLSDALHVLDRAAAENIYPIVWVNRIAAIGVGVSAGWFPAFGDEPADRPIDAGCVEQLMTYEPCDEHMAARRPRMDALREHLRRVPGGREAVLRYANRAGHFVDNRPYAAAQQAVESALAAGLRLMINGEGELEPKPDGRIDMVDADARNGFPVRRTWQRFGATCRRPNLKSEIINIVRARGAVHQGSGWIVLEGAAA